MSKSVLAAGVIVAAAALGACQHPPGARGELVIRENPCVDSKITVYFNEGSTRLTRQAGQLIRETSQALKDCTITRARVVGLTDSTGAPQANLSLSQRRAVAVAGALRRQGLPAPEFEIAAGGEVGATTPDGREAPVRRRAEVFLTVAAPSP